MMTDAAQQPNRAERDSEIVTLTTNVLEISDAGATIATGLNFIKMASLLCISLYCPVYCVILHAKVLRAGQLQQV